ncbi:MAG: N-acetylmuramoyl-L-alanine amidase, partial [Puniceicoccales bacterium]|nr:N-acetylmuramoyl-L-alanine amidase [Puniceicoccales bacterium]
MFKLKISPIALLFLAFFRWLPCGACCVSPCNDYVALDSIASQHRLEMFVNQPDKAMVRGNGVELLFRPQSRVFHANGILMPLGFPTETRAGKLCVTHSDYVSHIHPFFAKQRRNTAQNVIIVLDPGHGGRDSGASSATGLKEKIITLDICKKIAQLLTNKGYAVCLTRDADTYVELEDRTKFANQKSATLLVSVHCNSAESKSAHGTEIFTLTPYGQPSQHKTKSSPSGPKRYENNEFDGDSLMLAYNVQRAILKKTGNADRGVKHAHFHILKDLKCPGILVECGFLSNVADRKKLASDEYRKTLAQAIAEGIVSFIK